MAQYISYTVNVELGSPTIIGNPGTKFLANVSSGNAFKIEGSPVIYTIATVVSDNELVLSSSYQGATAINVAYQITRDFTPNYGFAEVSSGDKDWPIHLTQQTIRKIDAALKVVSDAVGTGGSGTATGFTHIQATADTPWIIIHNLDRYPSVTITDGTSEVFATVRYASRNSVYIDFNTAMSGEAYLI